MRTSVENKIVDLVERIRLINGAFIDTNFAQGLPAMLKSLTSDIDRDWVSQHFNPYLKHAEEIENYIKPFILPEDYVFFLKYYGGLSIKEKGFSLDMHGTGPKTYSQYTDLLSEWNISIKQPNKYGFLQIAIFELKKENEYSEFIFALDLEGKIYKNAVVRFVDTIQEGIPSVVEVIQDLERLKDYWKLETLSFTQFLEIIIDTQGQLST